MSLQIVTFLAESLKVGLIKEILADRPGNYVVDDLGFLDYPVALALLAEAVRRLCPESS